MTIVTKRELDKEAVSLITRYADVKAAVAAIQLPLAAQPLWLEVATGVIVTRDGRKWFCSDRDPLSGDALYSTFDPVPSARLWQIRHALNWAEVENTYLTRDYGECQTALRGTGVPVIFVQATLSVFYKDGHKAVWYVPTSAPVADPFHPFVKFWKATP